MQYEYQANYTGRAFAIQYTSISHVPTEFFHIGPASPLVRFMGEPIDVDFFTTPDSIPGRQFVWSLEDGSLPDGVTFNDYHSRLDGAPAEGGEWEFTVSAELK